MHTNPAAAHPRQTDLLARLDRHTYLVECKWTAARSGVDAVAGVRDRLRRAALHPVGVLVTMSGVTGPALKLMSEERNLPVLLVEREEIEAAVAGLTDMAELLASKLDDLQVRGRPQTLTPADRARLRRNLDRPRPRAISPLRIVTPAGEDVPWFTTTGRYDAWIPTLGGIPDPDWRHPGTVSSMLTMAPPRSPRTITDVLDAMDEAGHVGHRLTWTVRQAGTEWFGVGQATLREALAGWQERYAAMDGPPHHSEEVVVFDRAGEGFWSLYATVEAHEPRWVTETDLRVVLRGGLLDDGPVRHLAAALGADRDAYLRPLTEQAVRRGRPSKATESELRVEAFVVEDHPTRPHPWVVGIVAVNPYDMAPARTVEQVDAEPWVAYARSVGHVLIGLRHHHPLNEDHGPYRLAACDWTDAVPGAAVGYWAEWDLPQRRGDDVAPHRDP